MLLCPKPCKVCGQAAVHGSKYCEQHADREKAEQQKRQKRWNAQKPAWYRWYHTAHWEALRTLVLARDPICKICNRNASTDVDHVTPHKGNWFLFCGGLNMVNLQGLCAACHSRKTTREDHGFGH